MIGLAAGSEQEADRQPQSTLQICNSRRLWSLWEMLDKYAWFFFVFSHLLERLNREIGLPPPVLPPPPHFKSGIGNALVGLNTLGSLGRSLQLPLPPPPQSNDINEDQQSRLIGILKLIDEISKKIDVKISKDIKRATDYVKLPFATRDKVVFHIENITDRSMDELNEQQFLHVKLHKVPYYRSLEVLDGPLAKKFPRRIVEDLYHAGSCYAVEQHTACVFHLMRVMEHCVQRFGKKLKVNIDAKNEPWAKIMDHVNPAVRALPGGKIQLPSKTNGKNNML